MNAVTDLGRQRRARNLKVCHEVQWWFKWRRVISVEPDPHHNDMVLVRLEGLAQFPLGRNRYVHSRLAADVPTSEPLPDDDRPVEDDEEYER